MTQKLASDIEAKGFYNRVNSAGDVHCLCSIDVETDVVYLFHDHPEFDNAVVVDPHDEKSYIIPPRTGTLEEGVAFWRQVGESGGKLIIHNAHTYDRVILDKIWPDNGIPFSSYHDTFIQSKVQWFERPCPKGVKGTHGLQAYGVRLGTNKPEVKDWEVLDAFKLHRCIEDCKIQKGAYLSLEAEAFKFKERYGIDFSTAISVDSRYAASCERQERRGAAVDVPYIKSCVTDLDTKIEALRKEVEPELPPTLKAKGKRLSRKEVSEALGFDSSKIVDAYHKVKSNGEIVEKVIKPYYSPCTKWTKVIKSKKYTAYHFGLDLDAPSFSKLKDLRDWFKEAHPDTPPKEWVVEKEDIETEEVDANNCKHFGVTPEDTHLFGGAHTKIEILPSTLTQDLVVKKLLIRLGWRYAEEWNLKTDVHDNYIKVAEKTTVYWPHNANKGEQLTITIPKGGYMVSSPKLSEEDYKQLPEGVGKKIAEYNTYQHRRRFLSNPKDPENKGILSFVNEQGRIPCGVNPFGTRSGRGSHRVWVNAAGPKSLYGKEIRKCVVAPKGKSLVGIDMKSAQLSIAAYFANNFEYYNNVATGEEYDANDKYVGMTAHCVNARMFGMVTEEQWETAVKTQDKDLIDHLTNIRSNSKGGSFAVIFGASGKKVAVTIGIPEKEGHARKEQFLSQMGLDDTITQLNVFKDEYPHGNGFMLPLALGYWLWNNSPHKSVNTIVQGFEALAQKLAVLRVEAELERNGLSDVAYKVMDMHDEMLFEVDEGHEDTVGKMAGDAYTWAANLIFQYHQKHPNTFANPSDPIFPIDLNGGFKVGKNYYEVH